MIRGMEPDAATVMDYAEEDVDRIFKDFFKSSKNDQ